MSLFNKASGVVAAITRHNDITMVALLVIVVTLMIMPLPTPLIDTFIGANLTISFLMLMMSMYVRTPLEFSVFPTMLLFTTLFRVGLNITTTRSILLNADAGEIIFTFGEFATGSNFVVGAVVFLILTIIQFLVIAKGAERVAEVGARFTLDAMPGKQMSIDADLRAGVIDMDEAQKRRNNVQMESKMYGAMDGAMKFVKGDSIAGMIVTVVNIVGGTIIGVSQKGMSAGDALQLYGVLTIGDGLVSQIPSLLVSISAGILITRSGDTQEDVGAQVGRQFIDQPRAMIMAGGLIMLMAMIPGFPKPQLFTMAFAVVGMGYVLKKLKDRPAEPDAAGDLQKTLAPAAPQAKGRKPSRPGEDFAPTVPIILDISPEIGQSMNYEDLNQALSDLRRALYYDLGVPFPGINIRPNPNLRSFGYVLNLNEIPLANGQLMDKHVIVREKKSNLDLLGIPY
ncbi:MAG: FHIPEP family type III secretion protein, partial [Duodenibacillus sp.]|nr:FHIPEP family type III secretion protein [Duodenibacillus sp.]